MTEYGATLVLTFAESLGRVSLNWLQALGRFGNFMNGDAHGVPTDLPWGLVFAPETPAGPQFGATPLHPVMLYEMAINLSIFATLWRLRTRPFRDGFLFG
jgi:phosphatidylglycerol:prolipoprotein diacylglycerol transferase